MVVTAKEIEKKMSEKQSQSLNYRVDIVEDEKHNWLPVIAVLHHGTESKYIINKELFLSSEYQQLTGLGEKLKDMLHKGAYVLRGEKKHTISTFPQAVEWLIAEAKKGQTIQRYKGLGEMNPEQLWETTMNPETRRLLQVTIEDAVAADQIFTTLMGDQVEPRRAFIEVNALDVVNLDV
jgi:DNA gyrase subunit B